MFLLIDKDTKKILMSSARPIDSSHVQSTQYLVEIPDSEYAPDMVGGILHDD